MSRIILYGQRYTCIRGVYTCIHVYICIRISNTAVEHLCSGRDVSCKQLTWRLSVRQQLTMRPLVTPSERTLTMAITTPADNGNTPFDDDVGTNWWRPRFISDDIGWSYKVWHAVKSRLFCFAIGLIHTCLVASILRYIRGKLLLEFVSQYKYKYNTCTIQCTIIV